MAPQNIHGMEAGSASTEGTADLSKNTFSFPEKISIDIGHTLEQALSRFASVKEGLPEVIKNSKDQYARLGLVERENRPIIVLISTEKRELAIIDFAGASKEDFQGWVTWSSRSAGRKQLDDSIEAGYGNGGKAFMVHGATNIASVESCCNGSRTEMGFRLNEQDPEQKYRAGWKLEGGDPVDNLPEPDPRSRLEFCLTRFGASLQTIPAGALRAFETRKAYTAVTLSKVKDWATLTPRALRRLIEDLPGQLANHGQAARTVETCEVYLIVDGKSLGAALEQSVLPAFPGFEGPFVFRLDEEIIDPDTDDRVKTKGGELRLYSSAKNLGISSDLKERNGIRVSNGRNQVAMWSLQAMGVRSTSACFIYGQLSCQALTPEHLAGADRKSLADTPLARALQKWTNDRVIDLAVQIKKAQMSDAKPEDLKNTSEALRQMREAMRRFLELEGDGPGAGSDPEKGKNRKRHRAPKPRGERIDLLELEPSGRTLVIAQGTTVPAVVLAFQCDAKERTQVTPTRLVLKTIPVGLAEMRNGGIFGLSAGSGSAWVETHDGNITSAHKPIEVVAAQSAEIVLAGPVIQNTRTPIAIGFVTEIGSRDDLLVEARVEPPTMGSISRAGIFAPRDAGSARVIVRFGSEPHHIVEETIKIEPADPHEEISRGGGGLPIILMCDSTAPGCETKPLDERTIAAGDQYPTIIERLPLFPGVIWINHKSSEAMRVRGTRGGPAGVGGIYTQTFLQFLALKCFEVLKRLWVQQKLKNQAVSLNEVMLKFTNAEIECAPFLDLAWEISLGLLREKDNG